MIAGRDIRPLVAAVAAAVVIVAVALMALPERDTAAAPLDVDGAPPAGPAADPARVALPDAGPAVEAYQVFGGKNPFERPGMVSTTTFPTTTPGGVTTIPGFPTTTPGGVTTIPGFPTTTPGVTVTTVTPGPDPIRGTIVAVLDVYTEFGERTATIRVNGRVFVVQEGDVVDGTLEVVSIDLATECVDFLFGDRRFTLCVGQEIIK